ncbi:lytic transglycosylase domain-containing protein [Domibacillus mangrovi]|uniref:Transglycosylase SLT domain-containing protein n=1 Tax=Domibacillus mangrovi TaxID=1714354 RepID=A0A1Q5P0T2_9BACI|nr:lytic transglycosylase domain-containing protein [Domibacillus mangrovi]OKL35875.1 hypothetical protein BLL40_13435 [Domibacillus mangrovi]
MDTSFFNTMIRSTMINALSETRNPSPIPTSTAHSMGFGSILQQALLHGFEIMNANETIPSAGGPALYTKAGADILSAKATHYDEIITRAADTYHVPKKLIQSVIKQESNFNPNAVSYAGASGLMQIMPATARDLGVQNLFDPEQNVFGGTKYLRQMLDMFDGNTTLALAAYNAGPGNVKKYDGIPPFNETQNYVKKVTSYYNA